MPCGWWIPRSSGPSLWLVSMASSCPSSLPGLPDICTQISPCGADPSDIALLRLSSNRLPSLLGCILLGRIVVMLVLALLGIVLAAVTLLGNILRVQVLLIGIQHHLWSSILALFVRAKKVLLYFFCPSFPG